LRDSREPLSIVTMARELDVHPNTVRLHMEALMRTGQVAETLGPAVGRGRPPVLYRATHRMDPSGPTNYRLLAGMLADHLIASSADPATTAADLGRAWGARLLDAESPMTRRITRREAVERITAILADLGFEPEPPAGSRDSAIRLRHCPFLELTRELGDNAKVVCSLHLGLMQGAMRSMGSPVTVERLEPFVEPDLCLGHVASAVAATTVAAPARRATRS
jgi:predicted ArsR family transcriptional regulator